jgi:hypothetical protein
VRVTGGTRIRHRSPTSSRRTWEVHASARVSQRSRISVSSCGCSATKSRHASCRSPDPAPGRAGKCDVPGVFVTDPGEVWLLSRRAVTSVRPAPVPVPDPSRNLTSRASRGGHSLPGPWGGPHCRPGPPRDARDATPTAVSAGTRRPAHRHPDLWSSIPSCLPSGMNLFAAIQPTASIPAPTYQAFLHRRLNASAFSGEKMRPKPAPVSSIPARVAPWPSSESSPPPTTISIAPSRSRTPPGQAARAARCRR